MVLADIGEDGLDGIRYIVDRRSWDIRPIHGALGFPYWDPAASVPHLDCYGGILAAVLYQQCCDFCTDHGINVGHILCRLLLV